LCRSLEDEAKDYDEVAARQETLGPALANDAQYHSSMARLKRQQSNRLRQQ
jgi:hypothetical protein